MAKMASDPETQRWWDVVKPLIQPLETMAPVNSKQIWKKFFIWI